MSGKPRDVKEWFGPPHKESKAKLVLTVPSRFAWRLENYRLSYICSSREEAFWQTRVYDHASGNLCADAGHTGRSAEHPANPGFQNPLFYYWKSKGSAESTGFRTKIETKHLEKTIMYPWFREAKSAVLSTCRRPPEEDASGKIKEKRPQQQRVVLAGDGFTL